MSDKPILFLDVDGVLNAFAYVEDGLEQFEAQGYTLTLPRNLKERVATLLEHFEPVWCTAWRGMAHGTFCEKLGLPTESWPYIDYRNLKLTELLKYADGRPWAWVDDDAAWELRELGWEMETHIPDNALIVIPDARYGLTDEHVEQLVAFAKENS